MKIPRHRNITASLLFIVVLSWITSYSCKTFYKPDFEKTETRVLLIDSLLRSDSVCDALISPYKQALQQQMDEVLAYSEMAMSKEFPEGLLNNFVSDVILYQARQYCRSMQDVRIEFCILNSGGLRGNLPKGAVTRRHVFELMPFDNKICILTISGKNARKMFDFIAMAGGIPVAGIKMGIKNNRAVNIFVDAVPFDSTQNYTLATSDFLADGGDKYHFLAHPLKRIDLDYKVRDAIIEYLYHASAQGRKINAVTDGRIYYEQ